MQPLLRAVAFVAGLSALGLVFPPTARVAPPPAAPTSTVVPALAEMPCPPRHLPEGSACVPLPEPTRPIGGDAARVQKERRARSAAFDVIPRQPDRPADPLAYRWPLDGEPRFYRAFDEAPRDEELSPAAIELAAERGARVVALSLEGQRGPTKVLAEGRLEGTTVVTSHVVDQGGRERTILLVHGHLDALGPSVKAGATLADGEVVGFAGDSGLPGVVGLWLEARQVREDVDLATLDLPRVVDASVTVPTDLRNVLPKRP